MVIVHNEAGLCIFMNVERINNGSGAKNDLLYNCDQLFKESQY